MPRKTNAQFVIDAIKVHGNLYGYNNTIYEDAKSKVWITCKVHGDFEQRPNDHLNGAGCPDCGNLKGAIARTSSRDKFVEDCNIKHKFKFEYHFLEYGDIYSIIIVTCPKHGNFEIVANDHLNGGVGCGKCAGRGLTLEERKELLTEKHNGYYGYDYMVYASAQEEIIVTCPKHGNFKQQYATHLMGHGCDKCGYVRTAEKLMLNQEEFLDKVYEKFGDTFDLKNSVYAGMKKEIWIHCPVHGNFKTTPFGFLQTKYGCGKCAPGQGINLDLPTILYYFQDTITGYYKSGITTRTLEERFRELKYRQRMRILSVEYFTTGHEAKRKEMKILKDFGEFRVNNESWINRKKDTNGAKEFFNIDVLKRDQLLLPAP